MLRIGLLALTLVPFTIPTRAQEPSGSEIIDRYLEALGGAEKLEGIGSFHVTGTYEITSFNLKGTVEIYFRRPDQVLFRVVLPGYGTVERGLSGGKAWSVDPSQGTRFLVGAEADQVRKLAVRGLSVLPSRRAYRSLTRLETLTRDGQDVHKVKIQLDDPEIEYIEYYDVKTGLLVAREEKQHGPQGEIDVSGAASGYKRFGEVLVPTIWSHKAPQQEWTAVYQSIEFGNVSKEAFVIPAALRK